MYSPSRQHSRVLGVLTTLLTGETHFPWREQPAGGSTAFWGIMEKRGCLWPPAVRSIPSVCPPSPSPPGRSPFWQIIQGTGGWQANPQKWRLSGRMTISQVEKENIFWDKILGQKRTNILGKLKKVGSSRQSVCGSIFQCLNCSPHIWTALTSFAVCAI